MNTNLFAVWNVEFLMDLNWGLFQQMEDGYTQEALDAEEREKDLRNRLAAAEERVISSSSLMESARLGQTWLNKFVVQITRNH